MRAFTNFLFFLGCVRVFIYSGWLPGLLQGVDAVVEGAIEVGAVDEEGAFYFFALGAAYFPAAGSEGVGVEALGAFNLGDGELELEVVEPVGAADALGFGVADFEAGVAVAAELEEAGLVAVLVLPGAFGVLTDAEAVALGHEVEVRAVAYRLRGRVC